MDFKKLAKDCPWRKERRSGYVVCKITAVHISKNLTNWEVCDEKNCGLLYLKNQVFREWKSESVRNECPTCGHHMSKIRNKPSGIQACKCE